MIDSYCVNLDVYLVQPESFKHFFTWKKGMKCLNQWCVYVKGVRFYHAGQKLMTVESKIVSCFNIIWLIQIGRCYWLLIK